MAPGGPPGMQLYPRGDGVQIDDRRHAILNHARMSDQSYIAVNSRAASRASV